MAQVIPHLELDLASAQVQLAMALDQLRYTYRFFC